MPIGLIRRQLVGGPYDGQMTILSRLDTCELRMAANNMIAPELEPLNKGRRAVYKKKITKTGPNVFVFSHYEESR